MTNITRITNAVIENLTASSQRKGYIVAVISAHSKPIREVEEILSGPTSDTNSQTASHNSMNIFRKRQTFIRTAHPSGDPFIERDLAGHRRGRVLCQMLLVAVTCQT